jgi:hypothetical protein
VSILLCLVTGMRFEEKERRLVEWADLNLTPTALMTETTVSRTSTRRSRRPRRRRPSLPSFVSGKLSPAIPAPAITELDVCRTTIGYGSKDQGTHGVHGNPLKKDDTINIKSKFGFNPEEFFVVPDATKKIYSAIREKGAAAEAAWEKLFSEYATKYPEEAADIKRRIAGKLPEGWEKALPSFKVTDAAVASRKLSETLLAKLSVAIPEFMSGSADLTPSNLVRLSLAR